MTTKEKLNRFLEVSIQDATDRSTLILNDCKAAQTALFEDHKKKAAEKMQSQLKVEEQKSVRDLNIELSRQQLHIRRKISRKQAELKERLFVEVNELLDSYMKTEDYTNCLIRQINEIKEYAGNQYMIVYIDPKDEGKKDLLEQTTGVRLTISAYSFIGGTRTVIPYKNILIDKSFEKGLEDAKENYVFGGTSNE